MGHHASISPDLSIDMADGIHDAELHVVGIDHIDGDRVVVSFSDGSTATYTTETLMTLPHERVKSIRMMFRRQNDLHQLREALDIHV